MAHLLMRLHISRLSPMLPVYTVTSVPGLYQAGGLEAVLALYVPAGKPRSLPPDVLAARAQALRQPAGFASYEALRQWVQQTYHLEVNYHTLYTIVRTKFKAKLKVPRPSHTKKP
jgi:hypothetical protein